jgi:hypothetical protein
MPLLPRFGRPRRLLPEISDTCRCRLERTPDNRLRMEQIRLPSGLSLRSSRPMVFVPPCGLACQIKPRNDSIAQTDARLALELTPTVYDTPWVSVTKDSRLPELPPIDRDDIPQPASTSRSTWLIVYSPN